MIRTVVAQPYFPPPPAFNYSDVNYLILGRIAEKVTGQRSLKRLLAQRVVAPLGLDHTYFDPGTKIRGPHARGYAVLKNQVVDVTNWSTSYTWAAGSMVSTLGDLKNWGRDLTGSALLDHRLQRKRLNFISTGQGYEYGLGIFRLGNFCGHNGLIYGYDSTMLYSPRFHATIVILANASPQLNNPGAHQSLSAASCGAKHAEPVRGARADRVPEYASCGVCRVLLLIASWRGAGAG